MKALIPKSQVCLSYQLSRPVETKVKMLQTFQCLKVLCFCVMLESTDQSNNFEIVQISWLLRLNNIQLAPKLAIS